MARRYIGDAVIHIKYKGSTPEGDDYAGKIVTKDYTWKFSQLYAPRCGFGCGVAYDSPEAYDEMADSAASFGSYYTSDNRADDLEDHYPSAEGADAIYEAVSWAQDDQGNYQVLRRKPK